VAFTPTPGRVPKPLSTPEAWPRSHGQLAPAAGSQLPHAPGRRAPAPAKPRRTPPCYSSPWGWDSSGCPPRAAPPSGGFRGHRWADRSKFSRNQPALCIFSGVPACSPHARSSRVPPQAKFPTRAKASPAILRAAGAAKLRRQQVVPTDTPEPRHGPHGAALCPAAPLRSDDHRSSPPRPTHSTGPLPWCPQSTATALTGARPRLRHTNTTPSSQRRLPGSRAGAQLAPPAPGRARLRAHSRTGTPSRGGQEAGGGAGAGSVGAARRWALRLPAQE